MPYKDPEKKKEYDRKWREAHKERKKENDKIYQHTHRKEINNRKNQYRQTPMGRANYLYDTYRESDLKYSRGECTIDSQWIVNNIFATKCHYCGETDWHKLGCDRINNDLPHTPENVVCCCKDCNSKRGTIPFAVFVQRLRDGEPLLMKNRPDLSKPVVAINDAGEVVYEFPSTREAERSGGFNTGSVSCACRGCYKRDGNHRYKDLLWFYA